MASHPERAVEDLGRCGVFWWRLGPSRHPVPEAQGNINGNEDGQVPAVENHVRGPTTALDLRFDVRR